MATHHLTRTSPSFFGHTASRVSGSIFHCDNTDARICLWTDDFTGVCPETSVEGLNLLTNSENPTLSIFHLTDHTSWTFEREKVFHSSWHATTGCGTMRRRQKGYLSAADQPYVWCFLSWSSSSIHRLRVRIGCREMKYVYVMILHMLFVHR